MPQTEQRIQMYLLGQARAVESQSGDLPIQPKPLRLLAYLALNWQCPHRREELQALFWPDKPPAAAANNLRQSLWHLRQDLPAESLHLDGDLVQWNPRHPPWVDVHAFEAALDAALDLYAGPLLPDTYDEWAQLDQERLHLRHLGALEARAHRRYEAGHWAGARADAEALLAADPLNEDAARLLMACHWALGQREAARRTYDAFRARIARQIGADPLPETAALYRRILCGEAHPGPVATPDDAEIAARIAHLSLLETLGAFNQGLDLVTAWAAEASGPALAAARQWQGRFHLLTEAGRRPPPRAAAAWKPGPSRQWAGPHRSGAGPGPGNRRPRAHPHRLAAPGPGAGRPGSQPGGPRHPPRRTAPGRSQRPPSPGRLLSRRVGPAISACLRQFTTESQRLPRPPNAPLTPTWYPQRV